MQRESVCVVSLCMINHTHTHTHNPSDPPLATRGRGRMVLNASQIMSKVMNITHNLEEISDSLNDVQLPEKSTANSIKAISIYFYLTLFLILLFYSIYWLISKKALLSLEFIKPS